MTALLLTACVGMIAGAFLIFRISPMDFTLGVFHRLTVGPRSIRDEINEATQRKKPNFIRREILEAQTILKTTGKEDRFPMLCAASLLFFAVGAGIAKRGLYTIGQSYRGNIEGSDPKHSFHYLGGDDTLYVFEAPIDLLSYISLFPDGWREHNYVACCGTSSIPVLEMLRQLPQLRQVYLCLDNDAAGHAASECMAKLLEDRGISAERLVPQQKDWNDDLKAEQENKMERSELCQTFC